MKTFLSKNISLIILVGIFLFAYAIRAQNIVPERLLSFDPIFEYRYTKYLVDWGHLPAWDEISYYVGRAVDSAFTQPFLFYISAFLYKIISPLFGFSLITSVSYLSAIYGALIVIPAFFLGKELSNEYGGLLTALFIGTAPQILVRTFGSSYDTDTWILFFIITTLYFGWNALKKPNVKNIALASAGFSAFLITWSNFLYTFIILAAFVVLNLVLHLVLPKKDESGKKSISEKAKHIFPEFKKNTIVLIFLAVFMFFVALLNNTDFVGRLVSLVAFAQEAERWIVNISIAELQPFNIFSLEGWIIATGRFVSGDLFFDVLTILMFLSFLGFAFYSSYKGDTRKFAFFLTLLLISVYTSFSGIRFTEFTSVLLLIVIGSGFGFFMEWARKDHFLKYLALGIGILIAIIGVSIGGDAGRGLGPDIQPNWDAAWNFLKTQTPEFSLIGTWWDPGHMINGQGERRNIADGAHCGVSDADSCLYTINDRIVDLGRIMATDDENVSMQLIRKYQGNSPKVYWIASDDLIGKYQWLQFFGLGCDSRTESRCPVYLQLYAGRRGTVGNGTAYIAHCFSGDVCPVFVFELEGRPAPIIIQQGVALIPDEIIYYENNKAVVFRIDENERQKIVNFIKPLEKDLGIRLGQDAIPTTLWFNENRLSVVIIPENLRNTVFTKMFMLEGEGLTHFKQVFKNEQVKIYEVV